MAEDGSLPSTPTWAIAAVCAVLVAAALLAEHALHLLTMLLERRRRRTLKQALYHVKAELRSFGFMSLLLNVGQQPISKICIPESLAGTFLPCDGGAERPPPAVSAEVVGPSCPEGKVPLLSTKGTEQLLLFIIMLAVSHVVSCLLTFGLGMAKMNRWKSWEEETRTVEYQLSTDPRRYKLTRDTSFGRRHLKKWSGHGFLLWLVCTSVCFFRQFQSAVSKADYLALRHGFIMSHFPQDQSYDFHKYLRRSLDDDFSVVVGISHWSWAYAILFIFSNARGFYSHFWLPVIPLVMVVVVGTKQEVTITRMCVQSSSEEGSVVPGGRLCVRPDNSYFWLGKPRLILHIIHFILFQNAFQVAFFTWTWYKFGFPSCFHTETEDVVLSIGIGGLVQIVCAYLTFPLHVLVSRVGSSRTELLFTQDIIGGIRSWRRAARRSLAKRRPRDVPPESPPPPLQARAGGDDCSGSALAAEEIEAAAAAAARGWDGQEEILQGRADEEAASYDGEVSFGVWKTAPPRCRDDAAEIAVGHPPAHP